jgi:hypothetical protein
MGNKSKKVPKFLRRKSAANELKEDAERNAYFIPMSRMLEPFKKVTALTQGNRQLRKLRKAAAKGN